MDVTAAFHCVARGCLLRKMQNPRMNECLVRWADSFMRDRRVAMTLDDQDGEEMAVTTGLPQGSPVSYVLFAICIAETHRAVENQVDNSKGISFVDVIWLVEGVGVGDVADKLERCTRDSLD